MTKRLTVRDKALLKSIDEYSFLSSRQVGKLYFEGVNHKTVLRRLRKLQKGKWIKQVAKDGLGTRIWSLATNGLAQVGSDLKVKSLNKNTLAHDLLVSDVRLSLDPLGICSNWCSSHHMRQSTNLEINPLSRKEDCIPDWLISLKCHEEYRIVALEVELHYKGKRRMEKVLETYQTKRSIKNLWYLVPNHSMGEKLLELSKKIYRRPVEWFWFSILDEILDNPLEAKIHTEKGVASLKSVCPMGSINMNNNKKISSTLNAHPYAHGVSTLRAA